MPRMKPKTAKARSQRLTNLYIKKGHNKAAVAREEGVTRQAIYHRMKRKPAQETLDEHIQKVAKRVGINLNWLLTKYKKGANEAIKIIGFNKLPDWNTKRLYLRDIAEIMKWIKTNGKDNGKNGGSPTILISITNKSGLLTPAEAEHISHQPR